MKTESEGARKNLRLARKLWGPLTTNACFQLRQLVETHSLSIANGDLLRIANNWYVTHAGLLRIARRNRCSSILAQPVRYLCDMAVQRWTFKATVYKSRTCRGFVGYGDADPSNTSDLVRGAEMRVAETRAVNRALRKAYGIGICSVEEIGSFSGPPAAEDNRYHGKIAPQPANGNVATGQNRLRDRLCQLIRQHELDPILVKSYAIDFCGVKTLKEASREQVENFIDHVADWVAKDKNALVCQLNSYLGKQESVA